MGEAHEEPKTKPLRILAVGTEAGPVRTAMRAVRAAGHDVLVAPADTDPLAACRRHRPDVVLLDAATLGAAGDYLEIAGVMFLALDARGAVTLVNRKGCEILAAPREEILGRNWFDHFLPPDQAGKVRDVFRRIVAGDLAPVEYYENPVVRADGQIREIAWHNALLRDPSGHIVGVVSSGEDVTERKRAEQRAERFNSLLRSAININQAIARESDAQGVIQATCECLVEVDGYHSAWIVLLDDTGNVVRAAAAAPTDAIRRAVEACRHGRIPPCGRRALDETKVIVTQDPASACPQCPLAPAHEGCHGMAVRLAHAGRTYGLLVVATAPGVSEDADEQTLFQEVAGDVSLALHSIRTNEDRSRAEKRLQESLDLLDDVGRMARVGGWEVDAQTLEVRWTDETYRIHEVPVGHMPTLEEAIDFFHPDDRGRLSEAIRRALAHGEPYDMVLRFRTAGGRLLWTRTVCRCEVVHGKTARLRGTFQDITARKQAEEALQVSEQRYRALVEDTPALICSCAPDGTITFANRAYCAYFSRAPAELIGTDFRRLIPEADRAAVMADLAALTPESPVQTHEHRVLLPHGQTRWQRWTTRAVFDVQGKVVFYQSVGEDITEQKEMRDELRRLAAFPAENPHPVLRLGVDDTVRYANQAATALLAGLGSRPAGPPPEPWREQVRQAWDSGHLRHLETECLGRTYALSFAPVTEGEFVNVYGMDITNCKAAEKQREQALADLGERIKELRCAFGLAEAIHTRKTIAEVFHDLVALIPEGWQYPAITRARVVFDDQVVASPAFVRTPWGMSADLVVRGRHRGRIEVYYTEARPEASEGPFLAEERQLLNVLADTLSEAIKRDEADRAIRAALEERLESQRHAKELAEAELARIRDEVVRTTRLAAVGQVSASIAHDLRNPLGAVRNAVYYLTRHANQDDKRLVDYLGIIEQEVATADSIITSLLSLSRSRAPLAGSVDVRRVAWVAWQDVGQHESVHCEVSCDPEPFLLHADSLHIRQVLWNLLRNAVDAMDGVGQIRVHARREEEFDVIDVRDTGPGVPAEVRETLFEPLVTTKAKGTGLGLAICRQIAESHGGTIELLETGPGATFRLRLPQANETDKTAEET